ncbi:MAG TPA: hypothetical protein VGL72_32460 [Bryobacteraceae bacterium]|jgi:hypothetical protein
MKLFALLILSAAALPAQDPAVIADIDEAFRLAGVRTMLTSLPSHVTQMTSAAVAQFPNDQRRQFEPMIKEVSRKFLDPDSYYRQMRAYFVKHYDAGRMNTFLALERTPVYRTMHRLEEAADTEADEGARRRFENNLRSDPPTRKRILTMQRLDDAGNMTGLQVRMVIAVVNSMSAGLGAQMPPDLEAQSTAFTAKIRPILANNILHQNLFAYRNTDDAELEDYVSAAEQPDVAWFNKNLQSAMLAVAGDRAGKAAEAIKIKVSQTLN